MLRAGGGSRSPSNSAKRPSENATRNTSASDACPVRSKRFSEASVTPARSANVVRFQPAANRKAFAWVPSFTAQASGKTLFKFFTRQNIASYTCLINYKDNILSTDVRYRGQPLKRDSANKVSFRSFRNDMKRAGGFALDHQVFRNPGNDDFLVVRRRMFSAPVVIGHVDRPVIFPMGIRAEPDVRTLG